MRSPLVLGMLLPRVILAMEGPWCLGVVARGRHGDKMFAGSAASRASPRVLSGNAVRMRAVPKARLARVSLSGVQQPRDITRDGVDFEIDVVPLREVAERRCFQRVRNHQHREAVVLDG